MPLDWRTILRRMFADERFVAEDPIRIRHTGRIQTTVDIYSRRAHTVMVVGEIPVLATEPLAPQIDALFEQLRMRLESFHQARDKFPEAIVLRAGGTLRVPDWFLDFCRNCGIAIIYAGEDGLTLNGQELPVGALLEPILR